MTGSNAHFLSKDVITTFRGRGEEIKVYPLSFREYLSTVVSPVELAFEEYMTYGGLPQIVEYPSAERKIEYLKALFAETYLTDIKERYQIRNDEKLDYNSVVKTMSTRLKRTLRNSIMLLMPRLSSSI